MFLSWFRKSYRLSCFYARDNCKPINNHRDDGRGAQSKLHGFNKLDYITKKLKQIQQCAKFVWNKEIKNGLILPLCNDDQSYHSLDYNMHVSS